MLCVVGAYRLLNQELIGYVQQKLAAKSGN